MDFTEKRARVTGATGGIGGAITQMQRAAGASVAVADLDVADVEAEAYLPGDLTDAAYAKSLPEAARNALGGLDILINNAGVMRRGPVTASFDEDFDISVAVIAKAPFQVCRATIPLMAEAGGGAIVNTASCWGGRSGPGSCAQLHDQGCYRIA